LRARARVAGAIYSRARHRAIRAILARFAAGDIEIRRDREIESAPLAHPRDARRIYFIPMQISFLLPSSHRAFIPRAQLHVAFASVDYE